MLSMQENRAVFFKEIVFDDLPISNHPSSADRCGSTLLVVLIP